MKGLDQEDQERGIALELTLDRDSIQERAEIASGGLFPTAEQVAC